MRQDELNIQYFNWVYSLVCHCKYTKRLSYRKLLARLHEIEFTYTLPMDSNRAEDGTDLRYRFGYEMSYGRESIEAYLDNRPCSVLEMLAALALRCEEDIMYDPDIGDRVGLWFWTMLTNLGLSTMHDRNFDSVYVDSVIARLLHHEYGPHGEGGLFTVHNRREDLRSVEIWYQMNWYLNEIL